MTPSSLSERLHRCWIPVWTNLWVVVNIFLLSQVGVAQEVVVREAPIKAAYLYNFAKYIELPAQLERSVGQPNYFVIGVIGNSPVTRHLNTIASRKTVNGRPVKIKQLSADSPLPSCHLYYLASNYSFNPEREFVSALLDQGAFVVADTTALLPTVNVAFVQEGNRLRFDINLAKTRQHQIKISSQLLKLARLVHDDERRD